jgi:hypothetical protein
MQLTKLEYDQLDTGNQSEYTENRNLKINDIILIQDKECKITKVYFASCSKHGKQKMSVEGIEISTGKKYEDFLYCVGYYSRVL